MSNCQIRIINVKSGEAIDLSAPNLQFNRDGQLVDSSGQVVDNNNLFRIANLLIQDDNKRKEFLDNIKNAKQNNNVKIILGEDEFDLPTTTAGQIFKNDDIEINGNFRILDIRNSNFFGQDFGHSFIRTSHGDFIVMNSIESNQRNKVRDFLIVEHKLHRVDQSDDVKNFLKQLKENSIIQNYIKEQGKISEDIKKKILSLQEKIRKEEASKKGNYLNNIDKYKKEIAKYETALKYSSMSIEDLILSYIKFPSEFKSNIKLSKLKTTIANAVNFLLDKNIKEYYYTDENANTLIRSLYFNIDFGKYCADISTAFSTIVTIAESLIERKSKDPSFKIQEENTINQILDFYNQFDYTKDISSNRDIKSSIQKWAQAVLANITDNNFALTKPMLLKIKSKSGKLKYYLTFENQYQTIEERFEGIDWKQISLFQKESNYNGYNIYTDKDGFFYIDRHILTTKSYGKRYHTIEEAKAAIDQKNEYIPLYRDESIILINRLSDRNSAWFPYKIQEGRVIKMKDISKFDDDYFNFKKITPQNYPQFFKNNPEYTFNNFRESLRKIYGSSILKLNTAEDLYLFLAAIENNKNKRTAEEIINDISNINKYVYYQVTDVNNGKMITSKHGFTQYTDNANKVLPMYKSTVIPVTVNFGNFYKKEEVKNRFIEVIDNLKEIASQINTYFGNDLITVDSYTNLKQIEGLDNLIDEDTRGFIYNGKIYINSSVATSKDIFHEYTHLILGMIKASDMDTYLDIINRITSSKQGEILIYNMRKIDKYKFLSHSDIQEEAAAEIMGLYMSGRNGSDITGENTKSVLNSMVQAAQRMFSGKKANLDIANMNISDFFKFFVSLSSVEKNKEQDKFLFSEARENRMITNIIQKGLQANAKYESKDNEGWEGIFKTRIEENCE